MRAQIRCEVRGNPHDVSSSRVKIRGVHGHLVIENKHIDGYTLHVEVVPVDSIGCMVLMLPHAHKVLIAKKDYDKIVVDREK